MQVRLSDKDKELLKKVDTTKMGWLYDPILDESKAFQTLRQFAKEQEAINGRSNLFVDR